MGAANSRESKELAQAFLVPHPSCVPEAHADMMVNANVRLAAPLGEGGMGSVWVADHLALRTRVVVKFISASLKDDPEARQRFSREAAAAAQVKSPHVVQTFDHGLTDEGIPYIVMELLEGRDLAALIKARGRLEPAFVAELLTQLARGLDRAHERGIVHRDIKPENVFICDQGRGEVFVKLLDFGIAKGVDVQRLDGSTKTGSVMGSPFYMSPEQIMSTRDVDYRSDLWSVGVLVYEALTASKPFDAETMGSLAVKIHTEPLPMPRALVPELPAQVDAWFTRACARKPEDRFASTQQMASAFSSAIASGSLASSGATALDQTLPALPAGAISVASSPTPRPTRTSRLALAALVLAVGLGVGFVGLRLVASKSPTTAVLPPRTEGLAEAPTDPVKVVVTAKESASSPATLAPNSSGPSVKPTAAPSPPPLPAASPSPPRRVTKTEGKPTGPIAPPASPAPKASGHDIF